MMNRAKRYRVIVTINGNRLVENDLTYSQACKAAAAYGANVQALITATIEPMSNTANVPK